jgi:hypothetical protein
MGRSIGPFVGVISEYTCLISIKLGITFQYWEYLVNIFIYLFIYFLLSVRRNAYFTYSSNRN